MSAKAREARTGWLYASPWVIGFLVFLIYPVCASFYYAFCDYSVLKNPVFIGLENFAGLMHDEVFWISLKNTLIFTAIALPSGLILSLVLAMLLNAKVRGQSYYRTIFYLPSLMPLVATALVFLWVFNKQDGIVNSLLRYAHLNPDWLGDPAWSKPTLILLSLWGAGNTMIIFLAGLQEVPQSLYEAADLDGASAWAKTKAVTLPMISPVILFNGVMGIIGTLQIFTLPYVMFSEAGSPARSTLFYTMYLYDNAFSYHKMGYACAMGWIMFVMILILTAVSWRLSERHVYYGGN